MTTVAPTGLSSVGALLGNGNSGEIAVAGGALSLVGAGGVTDFAFDIARPGTITAISANYSNVTPVTIPTGGTATLSVQVFHAAAGSNAFTALTPVIVNLTIPGTLVLGTTASGLTTGLSQAVVAGDRYLIVGYVTTTGTAASTSLNGYLSAGINIT
jgi:BclB C-terminal domain-containing protein